MFNFNLIYSSCENGASELMTHPLCSILTLFNLSVHKIHTDRGNIVRI